MTHFNRLVFIFCLFIALCSFSHRNLQPEILDWDIHFKGNPDYTSNYTAVTSTIWKYGYTATINPNNQLKLDFNFLGGVDPNKSWVNKKRLKSRTESEYLLRHEQGHVYINFLLLKNGETLIVNQNYTTKNFKSLITKKSKEATQYYNAMQERYDLETKHGLDKNAQAKWDRFFDEQLKKLK